MTDAVKAPSKTASASAHLTMAVRRMVRAHFKTAALYAEIVRAVIIAEKAKLSRVKIARVIRQEFEQDKYRRLVRYTTGKTEEQVKVHKGSAARYVMAARWEQKRWLPKEAGVDKVEIDGHSYTSIIKALESEKHSWNKVFNAWKTAVRPKLTDYTVVPTSPLEAAEKAVKKFSLPLLVKEDGKEVIRRVKVLENVEALAALLTILHKSDLAKQAAQMAEVQERTAVEAPKPRRTKKAAAAA